MLVDNQDEVSDSSVSVDLCTAHHSFRQGPLIHSAAGSPSSASSLPNKVTMHEDEGEHDAGKWLAHGCHVIVFTFSGKPVYTRYGGEDSIAGFTGTLQALLSKFLALGLATGEDKLKSISVGDLKVVFLDKSPLILVSVSKQQNVSEKSIIRLLSAVHSQLMFVLTGGVNKTLDTHPNFDVRTLLGGTKPLLHNLISWMHRDILLSVENCAIEPLPLPLTTRTTITKLIQQDAPSGVILGLVVCGHRVIATSCGNPDHDNLVAACDIVLLINLIVSSPSLRSGESWTPVCLPSLSKEAFVYAYVQFLEGDIAFVCVSASPENATFHQLSNHCQVVKSGFEEQAVIPCIHEWSGKCPLPLTVFGLGECTTERQDSLVRVKHCGIVLNQSRQIFSSKLKHSHDTEEYKTILRNYMQCATLLPVDSLASSSQQVSLVRGDDFIFVWRTAEFQFFLTAPRGIDISVITYVYQWIRDNEQTLFISNIGSSGASGTRLNRQASSLW